MKMNLCQVPRKFETHLWLSQRHLLPSWPLWLRCLRGPRWGCSAQSQCPAPACPPPSPGTWGTTPSTGRAKSNMWRLWRRYELLLTEALSFLFFNGAICDVHHCLISGNKKLVCKARVWLGLNIYLELCPVWSPYIHMLTVFCILVSILRFPWSHIGRS